MNTEPQIVQGYVEVVGQDRITGWAVSRQAPFQPVELVLEVRGQTVARNRTALDRPDVAGELGCHRLAGFEFVLGPAIPAFAPHEIAVRPAVAGAPRLRFLHPPGEAPAAGLARPAWPSTPPAGPTPPRRPPPAAAPPAGRQAGPPELAVEPFPIEEAVPLRSGAVEGHFSGVLEGVVEGWAVCDGASPTRVELLLDGRAVADGPADRPRPDLQHLGAHARGFALALPDACFDGREHWLEVAVVGAAAPLPGGPRRLRPVEGGGFVRLRGGLLEGRVRLGERRAARLAIRVDGAPHPALPDRWVSRAASADGWFKLRLPPALHDGRPHRIALRDMGAGTWLDAAAEGHELVHESAVAGHVDRFDGGMVHGWAFDRRSPADPVTVTLYDADRPVASARTDLPRPDVAAAFGAGDTAGFVLPVPRDLFDRAPHRLRVVAGTLELGLADAREIAGTLAPEAIAATPGRFRGRLESVTPELVAGWAVDALATDRPATVEVLLDEVPVATVPANRYEPRFSALSGSGQHGFAWAVPARFWNGRPRSLSVRVVGAPTPLEGAPATLHLPHRLLPRPDASPAAPPRLLPAAAPAPGLVSIIVLNRNGAELLEALLASVEAAVRSPYELLVVDHGSTDASRAVAEAFAARLPLRLLAREGNFTFSASNNFAAASARGEHLLFLNNDVVLGDDPLPSMLRCLAADGVGAVGARLAEPVLDGDGVARPVLHHDGIGFRLLFGGAHGRATWQAQEIEEGESPLLAASGPVPAATAALLLVRKADFAALGGFDEAFDYGLEDVDLCLRLQRRLGKRVAVDRGATALHRRGATRSRRIASAMADPVPERRARDFDNRARFARQHAAWLKRRIRDAVLSGEPGWRAGACRVGFAVTSVDSGTAAGDTFTAMELAEALAEAEGWETALLPHAEPDVRGLDVLVAMRFDTPIRRIVNATPGLVTVAWIRNRVDQWIEGGDLDAYSVLFASSRAAADAIREATGLEAQLLPIATNPRRFRPPAPGRAKDCDVVFTGNHWGHAREAAAALDPASLGASFDIHGRGWGEAGALREHWRGAVPYHDLPAIYGGARLVLDDSDPVAGRWNSLNSRVFDAAACGALVLTNCVGGAQELLPGLLPAAASAAELRAAARRYLDDPAAREAAAARLREAVLARHTYAHRARDLAAAVRGAARRLRFGIKVPVPRAEEREHWGDWHFATALARALRRLGHGVRLDILPQWRDNVGAGDDVTLVLRGLSQYEPDPHSLNLLWLISHPEAAAPDELSAYDHVFVASLGHAEILRRDLGERVEPLLQCTDPEVFHPDPDRPGDLAPVVFVGNSRGRMRPAVEAARKAGLDLAVYGGGWDGLLPDGLVRAGHVDNRALRRYYANAEVVLNDHWPDMRDLGYLSNRLFDAAACGACIVTDRVRGLDEVFGGLVRTYRTPRGLRRAVAGARGAPPPKDRLRHLILESHTFDHRAQVISEKALKLLASA